MHKIYYFCYNLHHLTYSWHYNYSQTTHVCLNKGYYTLFWYRNISRGKFQRLYPQSMKLLMHIHVLIIYKTKCDIWYIIFTHSYTLIDLWSNSLSWMYSYFGNLETHCNTINFISQDSKLFPVSWAYIRMSWLWVRF